MDISFSSVKELYDRVYPALKSKVKELKKLNMKYIKEIDVWNYLVENKWKKKKGLLLSDIVDDILNTDNYLIDSYVKGKMEIQKRKINYNIDL